MPRPIYLVLGTILIVVVACLLIWWRSGWAMSPLGRTSKEILWLSCLCWGFLLMISAATEGVPFTSIQLRGELAQDVVGAIGLLLAAFGIYYGFSIGQIKRG